MVSSFVKNEKLRQALSFHTLLVGGNPMTTSAIYALIHKLERDGGVWFAKGGTNALVKGMVTHFERLGGTLRLDDPVERIETGGGKVKAVHTRSGWSGTFDAVASNADVVRTYDMLGDPRGKKAAARLRRKRFSPSLFVVHFATEGSWPDVPHHTILFGPRYKGLLNDIYRGSGLPDDPSLYLHHPTATDPEMAPPGKSTFYVLAPVPHLGKAQIDWESEAPRYSDRILQILEERMMPGLRRPPRNDLPFRPAGVRKRTQLPSRLRLQPGTDPDAKRMVPRAQSRRCHPQPLFRRGRHASGRGHSGVVGSAKATAGLMIGDLLR
jgi:phytoene desaturase